VGTVKLSRANAEAAQPRYLEGARARASLAAADRERAGAVDHRLAEQAGDAYACLLLP
jgi:hypothetical protein